MALVLFEIAFSILSIFIFQFFKSQSTNLIFNPNFIAASAFDIIVKLGIITSSFFFKFKDFTAISSAAVPLDTATEYL